MIHHKSPPTVCSAWPFPARCSHLWLLKEMRCWIRHTPMFLPLSDELIWIRFTAVCSFFQASLNIDYCLRSWLLKGYAGGWVLSRFQKIYFFKVFFTFPHLAFSLVIPTATKQPRCLCQTSLRYNTLCFAARICFKCCSPKMSMSYLSLGAIDKSWTPNAVRKMKRTLMVSVFYLS